ncbi:MAG: bi-domain-containing oxidoreductase [Candidatus Eisenbacteria bacterium]|nr:bi-domain-containing oxidoreductase [Candidatus Eisenbacteria bacterium]
MKQVSQDRKTGEMVVLDVPEPPVPDAGALVRTEYSLISTGTERAMVETGRESLVTKAMRDPSKVGELARQALAEGPGKVLEKIQDKLASYKPIGYSAAGTVVAVGPRAPGLRAGDRVACAGPGAPHAEMLAVPVNLCALVPDGVRMDHACAATLGAIALQGVRQADVRLGENVAVIGLGLLGQLTVQLLRASGCGVLAADLSPARVELALRCGASGGLVPGHDDPRAAVDRLTRGIGFDAVILTAATSSSEPLQLAGALARDRARVVLVGAVGGEVPRSPYYEKELSVLLSRSYGPGRYDPAYEEHGMDYPPGYVRWTEGRNLDAFLALLARGALRLDEVLTHRFPLERAPEAYARVTGDSGALGIVLEHPAATRGTGEAATPGSTGPAAATDGTLSAGPAKPSPLPPTAATAGAPARPQAVEPVVPRREMLGLGVIGPGSFAQSYLLPNLKRDPRVRFVSVCDATGLTARQVAARYGFTEATGSVDSLLAREDVHAVVIATRHDTHAPLVCRALRAGKSVFVEKPLALTHAELEQVADALRASRSLLLVGFNRRFAPMIRGIREALGGAAPLGLSFRVNAGFIPHTHWTQDPAVGGGRILGEGCHFLDLLAHLAGSRIVRVHGEAFPEPGRPAWAGDNASFNLAFENGSAGTLGYWASGEATFPKECLEIFGGGFSARLDDYREARLLGPAGERRWKSAAPDKGHAEEMRLFAAAARGEAPPPVPPQELLDSMRATLQAARSLVERRPLEV